MSFKKEVRVFIQEFWSFRQEFRTMKSLLEGYQGLVDRLEKQNEKLMDRIMSRSLPEFKTFQLPEDLRPAEQEEYSVLEDEDLAGEIMEMPEEENR